MNFLKRKFDVVSNAPIVKTIMQPSKSYPIFDNIVVAYVAVTVLFQVLFQISPVMSFFVKTPLYEMQTYLGLLGGGLILVDLFTTKKIWNNKYSLFLYIILFIAALSSVRLISYGVKENLFKLCWAAIQFIVVYSAPSRLKKEEFKKFIRIFFYVIFAIWVVCCCISLYQYINQIGYTYVVNPLGKDSSANRQGFYDNRLFGIFYTLNTAAMMSLFLFLAGIFFMIKEKALWLKIVLGIGEFFLISHMILSGSRSAVLAFFACALILPWLLMRNKIKEIGIKRILLPMATALVAMVVTIGGFSILRTGLSYLPHLNEKMLIALEESRKPEPSDPITTPSTPEQSEPSTPSTTPETPPAETPSTPETPPAETPSTPETPPAETPSTPEYDETILDRENLDEDYSNGRFSIWGDYLSLYKEIGLLGLSPGNYMPYVMEHHPERFIVEDIRINYPDKYESGIIYHGHNGYLIVFIATGFLGALSLLAFIILCIVHVIKIIIREKRLSALFICCFLIVAVGAIFAVLDEGLFFHSAPQTTLFWFALGLLINTSFHSEVIEK